MIIFYSCYVMGVNSNGGLVISGDGFITLIMNDCIALFMSNFSNYICAIIMLCTFFNMEV